MVLKMFLKKINYNFFFNQDIHLTTKYKNLRIIDVSAFIRYPKVYIQCQKTKWKKCSHYNKNERDNGFNSDLNK